MHFVNRAATTDRVFFCCFPFIFIFLHCFSFLSRASSHLQFHHQLVVSILCRSILTFLPSLKSINRYVPNGQCCFPASRGRASCLASAYRSSLNSIVFHFLTRTSLPCTNTADQFLCRSFKSTRPHLPAEMFSTAVVLLAAGLSGFVSAQNSSSGTQSTYPYLLSPNDPLFTAENRTTACIAQRQSCPQLCATGAYPNTCDEVGLLSRDTKAAASY